MKNTGRFYQLNPRIAEALSYLSVCEKKTKSHIVESALFNFIRAKATKLPTPNKDSIMAILDAYRAQDQ